MEISAAIAWLEELGLAHGDLRPGNVAFGGSDSAKLIDFDCVDKMGSRHRGNHPAYVKLIKPNDPRYAEFRSYGLYGAESE